MRGRAGSAALGLVVGLVVATGGCASLPDSSSVTRAGGGGVHQNPSPVRSLPRGPIQDASQADILEGYLTSMLAFPADPALVREFMTQDAAARWSPTGQLRVYEDPSTSVIHGGMLLQARLLGSVDRRGSWRSTPAPDAALKLRFAMVKVDGQWRVSAPAAGMLVDSAYFTNYFHQYSLYFFDPTYNLLAADPVYHQLGTPSSTATALVANLLTGPTADMAGVARSAAPPNSRLSRPVRVSASGTADFRLLMAGGVPLADTLRNLAYQLSLTLRQELVGVNHIRITINGQVQGIQGLGRSFSVEGFHDPTITAESRTLYALSAKGHLYSVSTHGAAQVSSPVGVAQLTARAVAVNPSNTSLALVDPSGDRVTVVAATENSGQSDTETQRWHYSGTDLLPPSWDPSGLLWLVDQRKSGAMLEVATKARIENVRAPGIDPDDISAFAVSRDGMRFAAVLGNGASSRLVVAMIKRGDRLTNVSLVGLRRVSNSDFPLTHISALAWVNATTLVVLAQDRSQQSEPYEVSIDGSRVDASTGFLPISPMSVAAGAGSGVPVVIGSAAGDLYVRTADDQWAPMSANIRLFHPTYPA